MWVVKGSVRTAKRSKDGKKLRLVKEGLDRRSWYCLKGRLLCDDGEKI